MPHRDSATTPIYAGAVQPRRTAHRRRPWRGRWLSRRGRRSACRLCLRLALPPAFSSPARGPTQTNAPALACAQAPPRPCRRGALEARDRSGAVASRAVLGARQAPGPGTSHCNAAVPASTPARHLAPSDGLCSAPPAAHGISATSAVGTAKSVYGGSCARPLLRAFPLWSFDPSGVLMHATHTRPLPAPDRSAPWPPPPPCSP